MVKAALMMIDDGLAGCGLIVCRRTSKAPARPVIPPWTDPRFNSSG